MSVILHWFLPTNGEPTSDLSLGHAAGAAGLGNFLLNDAHPPNHGQR